MTLPTDTANTTDRARVLLIVLDGLGFDRKGSKEILEATWSGLAPNDRSLLIAQAESALTREPGCGLTAKEIALLSLGPIHAEMLEPDMPVPAALATLAALRSMDAASDGTPLRRHMDERIAHNALRSRYVPWLANAPRIVQFRNGHLTVPTSAAGVWAGFEDVVPPVQGNSETGHQQIGSLLMAPQTPLEITNSIERGDFFENEALTAALQPAIDGDGAVNFCFMLSGTDGSDGRVHSAWNHLEAFLELVFVRNKISPDRVRMQAILDGRDGYERGSVEKGPTGTGNYLDLLEKLLARYEATGCLTWVVGRATAMDRDYREASARADYELLTKGKGRVVDGFKGARRAIEETHAGGKIDQDVPPLVVRHGSGDPPVLQTGDSFVNLNFRSDRQRAKTAVLVGAREFLQKQSRSRGRDWKMDWIDDGLKLTYCCMAQYDPALDRAPGVSVAFPVSPLPATLLELWPRAMKQWRYVLAGESVKASHVGYFIRGRREEPASSESEVRWITASAGESEGVKSDTDFHLHPEMKMGEVAEHVVGYMSDSSNRLIICNLSAPDMIGHLLPDRFQAAVAAYEATDKAVARMARAALSNGYSVILTSDHGNIEDDGPAHTANDVLTTVASPGAPYAFALHSTFQARLFDVSMTIARILGFESDAKRFQAGAHGGGDQRFSGRSIVA
jgi:2,3-bisphosphoglycerate-independent phosphoglycerate mutase